MGENASGSRSAQGHPGNLNSPLRIYTRANSNEHTEEDLSPQPGDAANVLLSSAFSQPYEEESSESQSGGGSGSQTTGRAARVAPRVGRPGAHYHPLPSHWREPESGSSGVGSPVTPDNALGDDFSGNPSLGLPRSYNSPREYQQAKAKAMGQSPVMSPRIQVGALREAFGSTSSLEWTNDRPGSNYSLQSTDQPGPGYLSEAQAESPLDIPPHGGRFLPSLSSMAARPGAVRSALVIHNGSSRHHPSASTSSSHYSYSVSSPPIRGNGATAQFSSPKDPSNLSAVFATASSPPSSVSIETSTGQSEDIVRKYLGLQRRTASSSGPIQLVESSLRQQPPHHQQSGAASLVASAQNLPSLSPPGPNVTASSADAEDESSGSIVFRRAVSSGDLPSLEELHGNMQNSSASGYADNRSFLTPDLVESPLEALVRRLTIELFQLYVSEDRKTSKKTAPQTQPSAGPPYGQSQQQQQPHQENSRAQEHVRSGQQQQTADEYEGFDNVDDSTRNEYVQQFRLGPSLQSGSTTPAVTMDGYFVPQKVEDTAPTADTSEVRPRPRHRLVQRTWMEEALIKARRVSTIDENAEESILEGLAQAIARKPSPMQASSIPAASSDVPKSPSPPGGGDLAQFMPGSGASNSANTAAAAPLPRVAHRGQALLAAVGGARNVAHRQASNEGMWARGRIDLTMLSEEPLEILANERPEGIPGALPDRSHAVSPRGYYRARDPAAPNRKLPAERQIRDQVLSSSISPARASLLRAVGRRQSVRLQPGKGQIVVADMEMGTRTTSVDGGNAGISVPAAMGPDSMTRAKRATSLPERMQVPETKEVSYRDLQLKAARPVELKRARKSRARMVHRAERMMLGGSKSGNARSDDTHESLASHSHNRTGSRPDIDQQLIKVELPPPVPLRVRREQVRIVPEPLIIVRQLAKHQQSIGRPTQQVLLRQSLQGRAEGAGMGSDEQKLLRVHNQLLGAQAVLSRHNSLMRNAVSSKPGSGRSTPGGGSATAAGKELSLKASVQAMVVPPLVQNTVRKEALEIVMLDNALDDRMEDTEKQLIEEAKIRRRRDRRENIQDNVADTEDSEAGLVKPWRNARRRSTLRKKERPQQNQQQQQHTSQPQSTTAVSATLTASEPTLPRSVLPRGRRLLLHGPAFRIYSGIRARPDTYLFLFTDMMVVTTRFSPASSFVGVDQMSMAFMAPPSSDPSSIPADSRFKFHIAIPLARITTTLKTMREGGSKRPGEDDDGEERRLVRQEERIRRACHAFEKNTSEAVVYLINRDIIDPVPDTVAGFLYRCTALSRRQLGSFLGTGILGENLHENPTTDEIEQEKLFHRQIWISFLDRCNIVGVPIDEALRSVMFYVRLPNNQLSISVLLEIAALQWFAKNIEHGQSGKVYVPDSQDMAIKLAFAIITLNTGLHNPLLRGETQPEVAYRDLLLKFRASV
ncbi:hypothetical protein GGF37_002233, partial [Kickxella alabastrina]